MNATGPVTGVGVLFLLFLFVAALVLLAFLVWAAVRAVWRIQGGLPSPNDLDRITLAPPARTPRPAPVGLRPGETTAACPECGAVLAGDSPHGLCARCLLQRALLVPNPTPSSPPGAPFVAPDASELAPHFPHLEIVALLGQGGMGAVYKARQLKLDRFVALKVLPQEWGRDPAFAERFAREARALARLSHPHIVAVHDFGEAGGYFYLLMEFVDGANLRHFLQAGPLDPRLALEVVPQICDALQYAHEEGVVHRDIKPENILLDRRGRVRIADFGLAKLVGPSRANFTLTGTHQVMGTLDYMAPEQRSRPQDVDHRADIYSLGVVFYEMLTGELPLGRFAPPSQVAAVDGRIDEVVYRALEREPDKRYQRVSQVRDDVESVNGGAPAPVGAAAMARAREITAPEYVQFQVQGPAAALIVSALVGFAHWVVLPIALAADRQFRGPDGEVASIAVFFAAILAFVGGGLILVGASRLRQFRDYTLVVVAAIVAMLPWSIHCLIGFPAGVFTFLALSRPEVRAAFAANLRKSGGKAERKPIPKPQPTGPVRRRARSFWRAFCSVFVSSPRHDESPVPTRPSAPP